MNEEELYDPNMLIGDGSLPPANHVVQDIDIYRHYCPGIVFGIQYSPLRIEKKSKSFSLYESQGKVMWKDHGRQEGGDVFAFVQEWYRRSSGAELNYYEANRAIYHDMGLQGQKTQFNGTLFFSEDGELRGIKPHAKVKTLIQVKDNGWTDWALEYWEERYNIPQQMLDFYDAGHAKEVWIQKGSYPKKLWGVSVPENPIYYYFFPRTGHIKCYRPLEKNPNKKWMNNCTNDADIQGYHQLNIKVERPRLIIFTKAMKEIMFYRTFHIHAVAIHGENHHFSEDFIRHIRKYSGQQICIYDNDRPGKHSAWEFRKRHAIDVAFIREAKNITDLWEKDHMRVNDYINQLKDYYGKE